LKPAIAQVSSLESPLEKDLADYAAGKCDAVELWVGKLDAYLEKHSADDFRALLVEHGVATPVISFQGGLLASQAEFRQQHWDAYSRRLAQCQELNIGTLVLAADIPGPLDQQTIDRVQMSLAQAAEAAGRHGVRLALEFQARSALINNLQTAAAMVAETASPHLGLCLDLFHYYVGPSKYEDLGYLTAENLFHVQLSDLSGVARELASDADRILPGDGDIPLEPVLERLRQINYQGHVSLELLNPQIWRIPPLQLGEVGMTALRKLLGQASMGVTPA
jgi:4-hydroxyphenylpyruvate dioxygenase